MALLQAIISLVGKSPSHPELAMGAVASGGLRVVNRDIVALVRVDQNAIEAVVRAELAEIARREARSSGSAFSSGSL